MHLYTCTQYCAGLGMCSCCHILAWCYSSKVHSHHTTMGVFIQSNICYCSSSHYAVYTLILRTPPLLIGHNFGLDGPISIILWFSESLQWDLSDDVFNSQLFYQTKFRQFPPPIAFIATHTTVYNSTLCVHIHNVALIKGIIHTKIEGATHTKLRYFIHCNRSHSGASQETVTLDTGSSVSTRTPLFSGGAR